jgi:hypothetical protein
VQLARTIELQSITPSYTKKHLEGQPRVRGRTQNTDTPKTIVLFERIFSPFIIDEEILLLLEILYLGKAHEIERDKM